MRGKRVKDCSPPNVCYLFSSEKLGGGDNSESNVRLDLLRWVTFLSAPYAPRSSALPGAGRCVSCMTNPQRPIPFFVTFTYHQIHQVSVHEHAYTHTHAHTISETHSNAAVQMPWYCESSSLENLTQTKRSTKPPLQKGHFKIEWQGRRKEEEGGSEEKERTREKGERERRQGREGRERRKDKENKLDQEGISIHKSGQKEGQSTWNDREVGTRKVTQKACLLQRPGELLRAGTSHFPVYEPMHPPVTPLPLVCQSAWQSAELGELLFRYRHFLSFQLSAKQAISPIISTEGL